jgi:hypothetical protein
MKKDGIVPLLPDNPAEYLTDWLFEIGPGGGMDGPLGWQEMAAWEHLTGIELDPWEARTLRELSAEYLHERQEARKPDRLPPYTDKITEERRAMVDRKVSSAFAGLKKGGDDGGRSTGGNPPHRHRRGNRSPAVRPR